MLQTEFPFLTVELLEQQGDNLLSWLGTYWPQASVEIDIIKALLPQIDKVTFVRAQLQHAVDWVNNLTGAEAPTG